MLCDSLGEIDFKWLHQINIKKLKKNAQNVKFQPKQSKTHFSRSILYIFVCVCVFSPYLFCTLDNYENRCTSLFLYDLLYDMPFAIFESFSIFAFISGYGLCLLLAVYTL